MELFIWLGILFCALKAATFSGLNLAYFSVPVLRLQILAKQKNPQAIKILKLRSQPNFLLSTILWGNVSYNVLLALLANSVMAGLTSFFFSTIVLTLVGEIMPQATFSRKALKFGSLFAPMIRFYQIILYPIAKPTALALNYFLGKESPSYYSERDLIALIEEHLNSKTPMDISALEGRGAIEFLKLDDRLVKDIGTKIKAKQTLMCAFKNEELLPVMYKADPEDAFIKPLLACTDEWMVITDENGFPKLVLDVACFIKAMFTQKKPIKVRDYCVEPIVIEDAAVKVSEILKPFTEPEDRTSGIPCSRSSTVVIFWQDKQRQMITSDNLMELILK